jgi:hypothetical protein
MKKLIILVFSVFSFHAYGAVDCAGVPAVVYAGNNGPSPSERSFWVTINGLTYNLGLVDDDLAKARYSMVLAALMSSKSVSLRFYQNSSCADASQQKTVPTGASVSS